jgi:hypothetical protein
MVNIVIVVKGYSRSMYVCEQIYKPLKMDGFINAFVGCNLFNMYTKGGSKKIWHEMIFLFVIQKVILK